MHSTPEEVHNNDSNNGDAAGAVAATDGVGDSDTGGPVPEAFYDELEDTAGTRQTLIQVSACVRRPASSCASFSLLFAKRSRGLFLLRDISTLFIIMTIIFSFFSENVLFGGASRCVRACTKQEVFVLGRALASVSAL